MQKVPVCFLFSILNVETAAGPQHSVLHLYWPCQHCVPLFIDRTSRGQTFVEGTYEAEVRNVKPTAAFWTGLGLT